MDQIVNINMIAISAKFDYRKSSATQFSPLSIIQQENCSYIFIYYKHETNGLNISNQTHKRPWLSSVVTNACPPGRGYTQS